MKVLKTHRHQITFYIIADNTGFGINGRVFRFHNKFFSTCKKIVLSVVTRARYLPIKWRVCYTFVTRVRTGWQLTRNLKTHFLCSWKLNWLEVKHFLKRFFFPFHMFSGNVVFQKSFATPRYIRKYTFSKKLIFSIAVPPLCLKILKKIPVKELSFSFKVSSLRPANILKNELFHFLFFKILDHDCRRTILESTFPWSFSETFLSENLFILKFR